MRISLSSIATEQFGWSAQARLVRRIGQLGYDTIWVAEDYGFDAVSQVAAFAAISTSIGLATGVISVFGRTPAMLAQTAAGLDRISESRFRIGLGTSSSVLATKWHGIAFDDALTRLSEAIDIIRSLIRFERLQYDGTKFRFSGDIRLADRPLRDSIPIYVGALTPGGLRLVGRKADGWVAAFFSPLHYPSAFKRYLDEGAMERPSSLAPLRICVFQPVVLTDDLSAGRDLIRGRLSRYVGLMGAQGQNYYARLFQQYGFSSEVAQIQQLSAQRQLAEAASAVTDEMVDLVAVVGGLAEWRHRLAMFHSMGVDEVAIEVVTVESTEDAYSAAIERLAPLGVIAAPSHAQGSDDTGWEAP